MTVFQILSLVVAVLTLVVNTVAAVRTRKG